MTRLRKMMLEELERRNYSAGTTRRYLRFVERFAQHFHSRRISLVRIICAATRPICSGSSSSAREASKTTWPHCGSSSCARCIAMSSTSSCPIQRVPRKLPSILSREEVARLIDASTSLFQRTLLMVLYGTGMRRSELARVKIAHIDSQRMILHVVDGKGHKDRDLPLSPTLLDNLRVYWRQLKPRTYLFPSRLHHDHEQPITDKTVWLACTEAAKKAGIGKRVSPHLVRHRVGHASARSRHRPAHHPASARP